MPNVWTHLIFAEQLQKEVNINWSDKIMDKYYNIGSQGPDPFFYYHFWPWQKEKRLIKIGEWLHKFKCDDFLKEFIIYAKKIKSQYLLAYLYGYLSHYILDSHTHPFIIYKSGFQDHKHQKLEIIIDTLIAKKEKGIDTVTVPVTTYLTLKKGLDETIIKMYLTLLNKVYGESFNILNVKEEEINQAYFDMLRALNFFFDPYGLKNKVLGKLISPYSYQRDIAPKDYLNLQKKEWSHPIDPKENSNLSFLELYQKAFEKGKKVMHVIDLYMSDQEKIENVLTELGNLSYETGKPCNAKFEWLIFDPII